MKVGRREFRQFRYYLDSTAYGLIRLQKLMARPSEPVMPAIPTKELGKMQTCPRTRQLTVRKLKRHGFTSSRIAATLGISYGEVKRCLTLKRLMQTGASLARQRDQQRKRMAKAYSWWMEGETFKVIGRRLGVSSVRASELVAKHRKHVMASLRS